MTVGDLQEIIKDLDKNMKVGGAGHYGEFLECFGAYTRTVNKKYGSTETEEILSISIESAGDEPD